jgi:hypothetical protein
MTAIQTSLRRIRIGDPIDSEDLIMYPLLDPKARDSDYVLAGETLARGTLEVTEVSKSGSVPNLRVTNHGERPVLILDGEELQGAKQNRVLNVTVMVPGQKTIEVPVSCVEAGRWRYVSRKFADADWVMDSEGRAMQMRHVSDSMKRGNRSGDQSAVWKHISAKSARLGARSATSAMGAIYNKHRKRLDKSVRKLKPVAGQVGAVFVTAGRVSGVELFDSPATFSAVLPKLVRSHAVDALDPRSRRETAQGADIAALLQRVESLEAEEYPAVGLGREIRLQGKAMAGAALVVEDRLVHLAALVG